MGNGQFKLLFPSHAMPFTIPGNEIPDIVSKINVILEDMEQKGVTKTGGFTIPASDGSSAIIQIDMPTPSDWILVDVDSSIVIHKAFVRNMVRSNGTYMVLPMKAAGLNAADLKAACARVAAGPAVTPVSSPPPVYQEAATGAANSATTLGV
ncbi:uncharacterized protein H6S33_003666 [Morchella sextelata]|uniref:uncharacterized protein n=1 Tax=Morchella sextelata TaxID=1174677 RepID=UPI001D054FD9|nr:uncharacterized protein H6S33_003666 [Morchella sextelata]KAH0606832.1 hypothetical protein H6S33_003666 [Morchella sextelata]